jgi:hypothetical protein
MILVKETTVWKEILRAPNHTYLMDDKMEKIIAYFKFGNSKEFQMFKKPIRIDRRYRQFKKIQTGLQFTQK